MWFTRTSGAPAISCSGTGSGAARNDQTENARLKAMSARPKASPVGNYVENPEPADDGGMVQCHAIGAACAAVMSDDGEPVVPKRAHDFDLVACNLAHAVRRVIRRARRRAAASKATEVGCDHGKSFCESRRDLMPHVVCLGYAVQQKQRRAVPA
jgi:hypothetical protein